MDYKDFLFDEQQFILQNKQFKDVVDQCLEDSLNVNPLEDGTADLGPYRHALNAVRLTLKAIRNKIIGGPYDHAHWQIIVNHLDIKDTTSGLEKKFWTFFSMYCALAKGEVDNYSDEGIYLKALFEIAEILPELDELDPGNGESFDMNTNSTHRLSGEGVHASFIDV